MIESWASVRVTQQLSPWLMKSASDTQSRWDGFLMTSCSRFVVTMWTRRKVFMTFVVTIMENSSPCMVCWWDEAELLQLIWVVVDTLPNWVAVQSNLVVLVSIILTEYIDDLVPLHKAVPNHILHKYSKEMAMKSEVVVLDVMMKNEAKHSDMIDIWSCHEYLMIILVIGGYHREVTRWHVNGKWVHNDTGWMEILWRIGVDCLNLWQRIGIAWYACFRCVLECVCGVCMCVIRMQCEVLELCNIQNSVCVSMCQYALFRIHNTTS